MAPPPRIVAWPLEGNRSFQTWPTGISVAVQHPTAPGPGPWQPTREEGKRVESSNWAVSQHLPTTCPRIAESGPGPVPRGSDSFFPPHYFRYFRGRLLTLTTLLWIGIVAVAKKKDAGEVLCLSLCITNQRHLTRSVLQLGARFGFSHKARKSSTVRCWLQDVFCKQSLVYLKEVHVRASAPPPLLGSKKAPQSTLLVGSQDFKSALPILAEGTCGFMWPDSRSICLLLPIRYRR